MVSKSARNNYEKYSYESILLQDYSDEFGRTLTQLGSTIDLLLRTQIIILGFVSQLENADKEKVKELIEQLMEKYADPPRTNTF